VGIRLVVEVLDRYHGPAVQKLWLLALAEQANDRTRQGWPARELLAARTGVSGARASNIATALCREHVIKRVGGGGRNRGPAQYEILAAFHSQGALRANPEEDSQSSGLANPEKVFPTGAQGSVWDSQGSESDSQGSHPKLSPAETPGLNPSVRATLSKAPLKGQRRASRRARPAVGRDDKIRFVRDAATVIYSAGELDYLTDEKAAGLWDLLVEDRLPDNPVAYLAKIFNDAPYLDTHLANVPSDESPF
jgi:hypothetical protein